MRKAYVERKTKETKIESEINLDGIGKNKISTGIGFLDHMIEQLSKHGLIDIVLKVKGDLYIDGHHTTEDSGYVWEPCAYLVCYKCFSDISCQKYS